MDNDFKVKNGLNVANNLIQANTSTRRIGIETTTPLTTLDVNTTDGIKIPSGNTAQRPSSANGIIRYNSETDSFEGAANSNWIVIAQADANLSSNFSEITTPLIKFEPTGNNSISWTSNSVTQRLANVNIAFANNTFANTLGLNVYSDKISIGANNISNTTANFIGNSTTNTIITQTNIKLSNSTSNITIGVPTTTQYNSGAHYLNANGAFVQVTFAPSGSNTHVQFNDSGAFGATNAITFNKTTNTLSVSNTITATTFAGALAGNANTVTNITSGQVTGALGYTPVRQGTGASQLANTVHLGWSGTKINLQIDSTNYGSNWPMNSYNITEFLVDQNVGQNSNVIFQKITFSTDNSYLTSVANTTNIRTATDQYSALNAKLVYDAYAEVNITWGSTITPDFNTGINFSCTLTGTTTLAAPTNTKNGQAGRIRIIQDGTGGRTLAYNSVYKFASGVTPIIDTVAGRESILYYDVISSTQIILSSLPGVR